MRRVGVVQIKKCLYPQEVPYHPSQNYKEYPFSGCISNEDNHVYDGIRRLFFELKFDIEHWDTPGWNPLGDLIKPGMAVVIKPNFVLSEHAEGRDIFSVITHPSVLRGIIDYCWIALKGSGRIIIADAPFRICNYEKLLQITRLREIKNFIDKFSGPRLEFYDLRDSWFETQRFTFNKHELLSDPLGSITVNLSKESAFYNYPGQKKLFNSPPYYDGGVDQHIGERQEYEISRTVLNADVFISVPKMKVHCKTGVSLNLKGLVGICTNKRSIIHCTLGSPSEGGDQFPDGVLSGKERLIIKFKYWLFGRFFGKRLMGSLTTNHFLRKLFRRALVKPLGLLLPKEKEMLDKGNWPGNDSAWRMVADLAKIIHFSDKHGKLHNVPQRKFFSIIDGVIGGENKGPGAPDPKPTGILVGGDNLLAVDLITTRLMGFDPLKLKQLSILNDANYNFGLKKAEDIEVVSDNLMIQKCLENKKDRFFDFLAYPTWIGHIEIDQ